MNSPKQGELLLLLSNRSGISKSEIAKKLNINPSHLSKIFKSQFLTSKIKTAAADLFGVDVDFFDSLDADDIGIINMPIIKEPDVEYRPENVEKMTASEVLRYLEEKDRRHHEERLKLLMIIENLTNPK